MPHAWALVDSSFPTFTGEEKSSEKIEKLVDYMKILVEALQYQLENLDTENWNVKALESFQTDTTASVEEQVTALAQNLTVAANELTQISTRLSAVEGLSGRVKHVEEDISYLDKDITETKESVSQQQEMIDSLQADMDELQTVVQKSEDGGATVGTAGKDLFLVGNVYINGKLIE